MAAGIVLIVATHVAVVWSRPARSVGSWDCSRDHADGFSLRFALAAILGLSAVIGGLIGPALPVSRRHVEHGSDRPRRLLGRLAHWPWSSRALPPRRSGCCRNSACSSRWTRGPMPGHCPALLAVCRRPLGL